MHYFQNMPQFHQNGPFSLGLTLSGPDVSSWAPEGREARSQEAQRATSQRAPRLLVINIPIGWKFFAYIEFDRDYFAFSLVENRQSWFLISIVRLTEIIPSCGGGVARLHSHGMKLSSNFLNYSSSVQPPAFIWILPTSTKEKEAEKSRESRDLKKKKHYNLIWQN